MNLSNEACQIIDLPNIIDMTRFYHYGPLVQSLEIFEEYEVYIMKGGWDSLEKFRKATSHGLLPIYFRSPRSGQCPIRTA
jgi:hypothetical protein